MLLLRFLFLILASGLLNFPMMRRLTPKISSQLPKVMPLTPAQSGKLPAETIQQSASINFPTPFVPEPQSSLTPLTIHPAAAQGAQNRLLQAAQTTSRQANNYHLTESASLFQQAPLASFLQQVSKNRPTSITTEALNIIHDEHLNQLLTPQELQRISLQSEQENESKKQAIVKELQKLRLFNNVHKKLHQLQIDKARFEFEIDLNQMLTEEQQAMAQEQLIADFQQEKNNIIAASQAALDTIIKEEQQEAVNIQQLERLHAIVKEEQEAFNQLLKQASMNVKDIQLEKDHNDSRDALENAEIEALHLLITAQEQMIAQALLQQIIRERNTIIEPEYAQELEILYQQYLQDFEQLERKRLEHQARLDLESIELSEHMERLAILSPKQLTDIVTTEQQQRDLIEKEMLRIFHEYKAIQKNQEDTQEKATDFDLKEQELTSKLLHLQQQLDRVNAQKRDLENIVQHYQRLKLLQPIITQRQPNSTTSTETDFSMVNQETQTEHDKAQLLVNNALSLSQRLIKTK